MSLLLPSIERSAQGARASIIHTVLMVPGFEGSVLQNCADGECRPLFLTPVTRSMIQDGIQSEYVQALVDFKTTSFARGTHKRALEFADYPHAACAPSPLSHVSHCLPMPAKGAFHRFIADVVRAGDEDERLMAQILLFDWRKSLLEPDADFQARLTSSILASEAPDVTQGHVFLLGHEAGCIKLAVALAMLSDDVRSRVFKLVCVSAPWAGRPDLALRARDGMLTQPRVFCPWSWSEREVAFDAGTDSGVQARLDMTQMLQSFGMRKGRKSTLPEAGGPHAGAWAQNKISIDHLPSDIVRFLMQHWPSSSELSSPIADPDNVTEEGETNGLALTKVLAAALANVQVTCLYGTGLETLTGLNTKDSGDGLIPEHSLAACRTVFPHATVVKVPGISHFQLLHHSSLLNELGLVRALSHSETDPEQSEVE
ncbi:hypothetical protein FVE85_4132 [Porphyridium purpureum]|uniref:Uncharacterized protein n=1 Tax=Porphyridium purpureum TaxID=35688 RepID=A0A5J4YUS4_PORPP|nr:hypothetical protein FVE85_4132 [Porphyridium purpureum]|eukprot:POR6436..scf229_5